MYQIRIYSQRTRLTSIIYVVLLHKCHVSSDGGDTSGSGDGGDSSGSGNDCDGGGGGGIGDGGDSDISYSGSDVNATL